jgi:hypothetical protein
MANKSKDNNTVVKIDSTLLYKIEEVINKEENRFRFANKKQFIDLAVFEYLKKFEEDKKKR